ncbi:MAG: hypothetical protein AAF518_04955 [Spirochaetota bacterium]
MKIIAVFTLFFTSFPIFSWRAHYLVTEKILRHPSMKFTKNEIVPVEPLSTFLEKEGISIQKLFKTYYKELKSKKKYPTVTQNFKAEVFPRKKPSIADFLSTARLNPSIKFPLVRRILPGQASIYPILKSSKVSPYVNPKYRFTVFEDVSSKSVSAASILYTYLDEPDWGMDRDLWGIKKYGYGKQPFGSPTGPSSQAPFHIAYLHENFMVKNLKPEFLKTLPLDRIKLFSRLSKLAMRTGHRYWGYRFAAWATNYIQDLCQPYQSKAVPFGSWMNYFSTAISLNKSRVLEKNQQIVANRQYAYEDFVALSLERSYTIKDKRSSSLARYLYTGDTYLKKSFSNYDKLVYHITFQSSSHSRIIDKTIQDTFGDKLTLDPKFDFANAKSSGDFRMDEFIQTVNKNKSDRLLVETGKDFYLTARATRAFWKMLDIIPQK